MLVYSSRRNVCRRNVCRRSVVDEMSVDELSWNPYFRRHLVFSVAALQFGMWFFAWCPVPLLSRFIPTRSVYLGLSWKHRCKKTLLTLFYYFFIKHVF